MADIELTLGGDSTGAVKALDDTGKATGDLAKETGKSVVAWQLMADVATKAASAVVKFGVDAVKMYAEAERVQKQLNRAAGEYGEILGAQAEALSKVYAVDDDIIKQSYTLLTQWGGVGAATEETTKAVLNYAAATGTDAVSATQALIRNVESGGVGLAKMGIHFEATGKRGDDLAAAVGAINAKLVGAAEGDAQSLVGGARAAHLAFEDLQKSVGGMLGAALDKSGALGFITEQIRTMTVGASALSTALEKLPGFLQEAVKGRGFAENAIIKETMGAMDSLLHPASKALPGVENVATNKGLKDAASTKPGRTDEERLADAKKYYDGIETLAATAAQQEADAFADDLAREAERVKGSIKIREDGQKAYDEIRLAEEKAAAAHAEKISKDAAKVEEKALKDQQDRVAKKEKEAQQAGDQIGAAMVNALAEQLAKLAEGGEFDAALFIGDILAAAVGIAGTVIGTAFGAPAVGAALGNLAAMGVRAGSSAISKGNKPKPRTYHEGGEIDHWPRFHSGGGLGSDEVPIIAQPGEHMLSRRDVANMGGHSGVQAAKSGGRAVVIQAIDAKSMADTFSDRGGEGLKQALRRGHGALPALFGKGPR